MAGVVKGMSKCGFNRVLVGDVIWRQVALPAILHGVEIIQVTKGCMEAVEGAQKGLGRVLTGARRGAPISAIRGELGWERVKAWIEKRQINFYGRLKSNPVKSWATMVLEKLEQVSGGRKSAWLRKVEENMTKLEIGEYRGASQSRWKKGVKRKVCQEEEDKWRSEVEELKSIYRFRKRPRLADYWKISEGGHIIFGILTGTLATRSYLQKIGQDRSGKCICGEEENISHFMLYCERWEDHRRELIKLIEERGEEVEEEDEGRIGQMIGMNEELEMEDRLKIGGVIRQMWREREKVMTEVENQ
jgi:hypothetical protein